MIAWYVVIERGILGMVKILLAWLLVMFTLVGGFSFYFALTVKQEELGKLTGFHRFLYWTGLAVAVIVVAGAIMALIVLAVAVLYRIL